MRPSETPQAPLFTAMSSHAVNMKHLLHGSSILWSYRRHYNIVGDLIRHLRWLPALLSSATSYLTL
eukprot:scaffold6777_cov167-Skeletonema_dohrnii-CCMP3373.AAC.1